MSRELTVVSDSLIIVDRRLSSNVVQTMGRALGRVNELYLVSGRICLSSECVSKGGDIHDIHDVQHIIEAPSKEVAERVFVEELMSSDAEAPGVLVVMSMTLADAIAFRLIHKPQDVVDTIQTAACELDTTQDRCAGGFWSRLLPWLA